VTTWRDDYNYWNKAEKRALARSWTFVVTHLHPL